MAPRSEVEKVNLWLALRARCMAISPALDALRFAREKIFETCALRIANGGGVVACKPADQ
jgi:hypothetical protein